MGKYSKDPSSQELLGQKKLKFTWKLSDIVQKEGYKTMGVGLGHNRRNCFTISCVYIGENTLKNLLVNTHCAKKAQIYMEAS
jgi:hypothetical protein